MYFQSNEKKNVKKKTLSNYRLSLYTCHIVIKNSVLLWASDALWGLPCGTSTPSGQENRTYLMEKTDSGGKVTDILNTAATPRHCDPRAFVFGQCLLLRLSFTVFI